MPISHPLRTIFVHQVRDEQRLYGGELQHLTAAGIKAQLRDEATFREYFKFTIVRNPWERLVSTCAWTDQKWARGEELEPAPFAGLVRQLDELFRASRRASSPLTVSHHLQPQFQYVFDEQLQPMVDFIARYENLEQDWGRIGERLNIDMPLPMRMRSHHRPYREYYSAETRAMIARPSSARYGRSASIRSASTACWPRPAPSGSTPVAAITSYRFKIAPCSAGPRPFAQRCVPRR